MCLHSTSVFIFRRCLQRLIHTLFLTHFDFTIFSGYGNRPRCRGGKIMLKKLFRIHLSNAFGIDAESNDIAASRRMFLGLGIGAIATVIIGKSGFVSDAIAAPGVIAPVPSGTSDVELVQSWRDRERRREDRRDDRRGRRMSRREVERRCWNDWRFRRENRDLCRWISRRENRRRQDCVRIGPLTICD